MSTFSESHLHIPDLPFFVSSRARLQGSPALLVLSPLPSLPRRFCSATPRGTNDSVCTQCLGVAFGEVERTPLLGCFLTRECFVIEVIHPRSTSRHHAACCCCLRLATLLRRLSEGCGQHLFVEDFGLCCVSFLNFSLSVFRVPHVAEYTVPAVCLAC